jgi:hypothetical protein
MGWHVPRLWEGGECWIIGGGLSMPREFGVPEEIIESVIREESTPAAYSPYMSAIHDRHIIAINVAYLIGTWIDMVFFGDNRLYITHRENLAQFPGLKVACNPKLRSPRYQREENIKYVPRDKQHKLGISDNPCTVSWNHNSGAAAISVAANMGARRIILLGFDMKLSEDGKQHWHSLYRVRRMKGRNEVKAPLIHLPFKRHLRCFPHIAKDARRRGIEIINASPDSAIENFRKLSVNQILSET